MVMVFAMIFAEKPLEEMLAPIPAMNPPANLQPQLLMPLIHALLRELNAIYKLAQTS
jgi:hypothetical protein